MKRPGKEEVEREIAALDQQDISALQERWRQLYRVPSPISIRRGFLIRAIAYRVQELVYGGLKPATLKQMRTIAAHARSERQRSRGGVPVETGTRPSRRIVLQPGSQLLREWNGTAMVVDVLADGFAWRGTTYPTLSAVAVAITGTKWSGPKFFGLGGAKQSRNPPGRHGSTPRERGASTAADVGASP